MSDRYTRITELGWQRAVLQKATVMVVGAGALGNEVLKDLTLLGIGNILVVDMDTIENHNLTRTVLFRTKDIGKYKAEVAAKRVNEIDENVNIRAFVGSVQSVFGMGVYKNCDIVFGCLDNIQARIDLNRYCYQTNTLYIDAGLRKLDGDVKIFGNGFEVCLDCTLTQRMRNEAWQRYSCLKLRTRAIGVTIPTAPTIASIMAGFQVQIGMKYLHDAEIPIGSRISVLGYIDDINKTRLHKNIACPTHNLYEPIALNEIRKLPYRSAELTVGGLLDIAEQELGEMASIELDYDLITHFECKKHNYHKQLFRRRGYVYVDEVECSYCKQSGLTGNHLLMQEYFTNQINRQSPQYLLNQTLSEIGTPLYAIFRVKALQNDEMVYAFYEISGDRELVFGEKGDN
ncbi:MAG: ThiF family adenylyltransferase [Chitinophagales bacterium]